jgi:uncharacterized protein YndB with AHSA1/START domain
VPTARVSRTLPATSAAVWRVAADPYAMARWWPRVERMEGITARKFTQVLRTPRGRAVRADFRVTEQEQGRRRVWSQDLEGSPFERILLQSVTELRVVPTDDGEAGVTLELRQKLRGMSRFGGFMARRAARKTLREALEGLERAVAEEMAPS